MSNITDRSSLGMKWYTFYIKVRPWIGFAFFLLSVFAYGETSLILMSINLVGAAFAIPTIVYVASCVVHIIANLILFFKERNGSGEALLGFIKGLLIFEVFYIPYGSILEQYYEGQSIVVSIIVLMIMMTLCYFVWYRLNIKYFRKRLANLEFDSTMTGAISEEPKVADVTKTTEQRPSYAKYCPKCGKGIDPVSKVCTGCGKQYFKGVPWKTLGVVVAIVLLVASIGLNAYMYSDYAKAQETIVKLTKKNNDLADNVAELKDDIVDLKSDLRQYKDLADFCDEYVVFVEDDGTDLYHKFECNRFKGEWFWVFNIDAAEDEGYEPCPSCYN